MSNVFFTSDNHFFHDLMLKIYTNTRRGADVLEMNELMIQEWNSTVKPEDVVYCVGDFAMSNAKNIKSVLGRLNGELHMITGNHDKVIKSDYSLQKYFKTIQTELDVSVAGQRYFIYHYPIFEWNGFYHGVIHIHGHVHGKMNNVLHYNSVDVGIDARSDNLMRPFSLEEVLQKVQKQKEAWEDNPIKQVFGEIRTRGKNG